MISFVYNTRNRRREINNLGKGDEKMRFLSDIEREKLLLYIQHKADLARRKGTKRAIVDELIVQLLLNTGLFPSELCNLNIDDLITEQGRKYIRIRDVSGTVLREVDVTGDIVEHVQRFVRLYRRKTKPGDPLLVSERGTRFSYMSLYNKVKRIGRQARIGNLHPRVLRNTYLVRLYGSEQDLQFVQQQAGHASPRTTAMYAIAASDREVPAVSPNQAESGTLEQTQYSNRQAITEKHQVERTAKQKETIPVEDLQKIEKCEVCTKTINAGTGTRIDSGQILCSGCLKELRGT